LDIPATFPGGRVISNTENPYLATEGQTVVLTIIPDGGYECETILVYLYGTTTLIPLTGTGLTRTFVMPAGHITVSASFKDVRLAIDAISQANGLKAYVENGELVISGVSAGTTWRVYNILGTLIYQSDKTLTGFRLPGRGIYMVTDGKTVVKIIY